MTQNEQIEDDIDFTKFLTVYMPFDDENLTENKIFTENSKVYLPDRSNISKYTTFMDYKQIKCVEKNYFSNFIDSNTFDRLKNGNIINWESDCVEVFPIRTPGDGNCLCHAVLIYLIGCDDRNLVLRDALHDYINGKNEDKIKERFMSQRTESNATMSIQTEANLLNEEWDEIKRMCKKQKITLKDGTVVEKTVDSLMYLEDIHIFALANFLKRTIIVLGLETIKGLQINNIRGIYLPVLNSPSDCENHPILIAFHNYHFSPLLFSISNSTKSDKSKHLYTKLPKYTALFPIVYNNTLKSMEFHFLNNEERQNVNKLLKNYLDVIILEDKEHNETKCCYIGTDITLKNNALSKFMSYLQEKQDRQDQDEAHGEKIKRDNQDNNVNGEIKNKKSKSSDPKENEHQLVKDGDNDKKNVQKIPCAHNGCKYEGLIQFNNYCDTHFKQMKKKCKNENCENQKKWYDHEYCENCSKIQNHQKEKENQVDEKLNKKNSSNQDKNENETNNAGIDGDKNPEKHSAQSREPDSKTPQKPQTNRATTCIIV